MVKTRPWEAEVQVPALLGLDQELEPGYVYTWGVGMCISQYQSRHQEQPGRWLGSEGWAGFQNLSWNIYKANYSLGL